MTRVYLITALLLTSFTCYSQACNDSLVSLSLECTFGKLNLEIPCDYVKADHFDYTEGTVWTISYTDSSSISVLCGFQANLSNSDKKKPGLFYKKVKVKGYEFTYDNVPKNRLSIFEKAFKLLDKEIAN